VRRRRIRLTTRLYATPAGEALGHLEDAQMSRQERECLRAAARLGRSAIAPLTPGREQIAKSGSRKSEAKKEEDEPDDGSEGYDCGVHWTSY